MNFVFKRSLVALPVATVLGLGSGLALAQATTPAADKAKAATATQAAAKPAADARPATRDWSQVDANKDGSISPDEMEAYLKANPGPLAKK